MKYVGSKNRLAKHILPLILADRKESQTYVEPFAGGMNLIQHVKGKRIANDINEYVIAMFEALVHDNWEPPTNMSEEQYQWVKQHPELFSKEYVGFLAIGCSYGGKWFGGYARGNKKDGTPRNYCLESRKNVLKQKSRLQGVTFCSTDYQSLQFPPNSIVYCDIPYSNTINYRDKFDTDMFWQWARKISNQHQVFVSEYSAPDDITCIWQKETSVSIDSHKTKKRIEKLYKL